MINNIKGFVEQLNYDAEVFGKEFEYSGKRVFISGMGGSGAVADLLSDWLDGEIIPVKGYNLSVFAENGDLGIFVSYSGNTEETLSVLDKTLRKGLRCICISSGGALEEIARDRGLLFLKVPSGFQPREAYGFLISAVVKALKIVGYLSEDAQREYSSAVGKLSSYLPELSSEDSKTYEVAGKLYRRIPLIYSQFYSVAVRWKNQINENAKNFAHISIFPEHNHNEIEGFEFPDFFKDKAWIIFLRTDFDHGRVKLRMEAVKEILREEVVGISEVWAKGESKLEQILYLIWFGDFVSYWLALMNSTDPYRIDRINSLKERLKIHTSGG